MIWALASAVTGWFYAFTFKVIAQRNYDTYIATFLGYFVATILSVLYILFLGSGIPYFSDAFLLILALWFWNILFYTASIVTRVESMRNIDSVIFFPLYKTFWPIMVTFISYYGFKEWLTTRDVLGIIVWICVPLMLLTKTENRIQKNLYVGVVLVVVTALLTSISSIIPKYIQVQNFNYELFILASFFFGIFFSAAGYVLHKKNTQRVYHTHGVVKFWLLTGFIHYLAFYAFMRAMEGNLAIAFTINSFSILIPIILSIIFYWEHFNLKKGLVIALSVVSILLFL